MQEDFHYYATYCAAYLAGFSHEESLEVCFAAQFVDICTATFLSTIDGPKGAATTQLNLELMDMPTNPPGIREITSIWSSFHFLPYDLNVKLKGRSKAYMRKYRLICNPNSVLLKQTVDRAKNESLQAVGIAMHVLADTWAHRYFVGTPSLVINNTDSYFFEVLRENGADVNRKITWKHSTSFVDDIDTSTYVNSLYQYSENSIMNLGHGRAGHLPDYSFIRYKYLPAWNGYEEIVKDNPTDFYHAFSQMVYAMKTLRNPEDDFELNYYDFEALSEWESEIRRIIETRRLSAADDWKAFGEKLSGKEVIPFNLDHAKEEYLGAEEKDNTVLGRFFKAAMEQKKLVTSQIYAAPVKKK